MYGTRQRIFWYPKRSNKNYVEVGTAVFFFDALSFSSSVLSVCFGSMF